MSEQFPILFEWDGEVMRPANSWAKRADRAYVVGEKYRLSEEHERSASSHRHYFGAIAEAHSNLPENLAEQFLTEEHLRKWALIKANYADERSIVCSTKAEAQRVAAFIKPMDAYAVVVAKEAVVKVFTAKSQSTKAMGKKEFQESKTAVLEIIAGMVGVTPVALEANAGQAA